MHLDYFLKKYEIKDKALHTIALIVRGADPDRHELAAESQGLWAISSGLAYNFKNDYELLQSGMLIYDALYSWAKYLQNIKQPFEILVLEVFNKYIEK